MGTSIQRNHALDGVYCAGICSELSATLNASLGSDFILTADYWVHIDGIYKQSRSPNFVGNCTVHRVTCMRV